MKLLRFVVDCAEYLMIHDFMIEKFLLAACYCGRVLLLLC